MKPSSYRLRVIGKGSLLIDTTEPLGTRVGSELMDAIMRWLIRCGRKAMLVGESRGISDVSIGD